LKKGGGGFQKERGALVIFLYLNVGERGSEKKSSGSMPKRKKKRERRGGSTRGKRKAVTLLNIEARKGEAASMCQREKKRREQITAFRGGGERRRKTGRGRNWSWEEGMGPFASANGKKRGRGTPMHWIRRDPRKQEEMAPACKRQGKQGGFHQSD